MIEIEMGSGHKSRGGLVLVRITTIEGNTESNEKTWAKPLGDDLYELTKPLHFTTGFNVGDVVRAVASSTEETPSVQEVIRRSGHQTLHILMCEGISKSNQQNVLDELNKWDVDCEMAFDRFYTIAVGPRGNYSAVCDYLRSLSVSGILLCDYEVDLNTLLKIRIVGSSGA